MLATLTCLDLTTKTMSALGQENMGIMRLTPNDIETWWKSIYYDNVIENSNFTGYDMMRKLFNQISSNANPHRYK